jgi:sigma-E factor negative regulatory protein RseC
MIEETGTVVSVEQNAVWVQTIQKSACSSCGAEKNCGQNTLLESFTGKPGSQKSVIRAQLKASDTNSYQVDDQVVIGVPEQTVVYGTLLLYLLPMTTLILAVVIAYSWGASDAGMALGAVLGLLAGGMLVRFHSRRHRREPLLDPVVLKKLV